MIWYLLAIAGALLLSRWAMYAMRPTPQVVLPSTSKLHTVGQLFGPAEEGEQDAPLQGEPLLREISSALQKQGFVVSEPGPASYGYSVDVTTEGKTLSVNIGLRGEEEGAPEWLVLVDPRRGSMKTLLEKGQEPAGARELLEVLHEVLSARPDVKRLVWHDAARWDRGEEDDGRATPF